VTGLLPDVIRDGVEARSLYGASISFGVVALALLVVMLIESEALRVATPRSTTSTALSAVALPLLLAVMLTIAARVAALV
jgi:purine-nucleoside phosphorylase